MSVKFVRLRDGSGALLDLRTMEFSTMNPSGARLYELSATGVDEAELVERLVADGVDRAVAVEAVAAFRLAAGAGSVPSG